MDRLKGSGTTFSTSGKSWRGFRFNAKIAKRQAKLRRLQKRGLLPPTDKASLRRAAEKATGEF